MPNLAVLYMQGNGVSKKIKNYRKTLIARIPTLKYLDDRPVFEDDRRNAEAFARGGIEEERNEREKIKQEKDEAHWKNHEAF
jgi:dynein assembly factor 1